MREEVASDTVGHWRRMRGVEEKKRRLGERENEEGFDFISELQMLQVNPTVKNDTNQSNDPK